MLHTKAQGHWPFGSGEEDFWRVFTIYGRGSHLGHVTQMPQTNFRSPNPWRLHMKFGLDWPSGFGEKDLWKWWTDGRTPTNNGRRTDDGACLYYKLTNEPKGSGELKSDDNFNVWKLERKKCEEIKRQKAAAAWFRYTRYIRPLFTFVPSFNFVGHTVPEQSANKLSSVIPL